MSCSVLTLASIWGSLQPSFIFCASNPGTQQAFRPQQSMLLYEWQIDPSPNTMRHVASVSACKGMLSTALLCPNNLDFRPARTRNRIEADMDLQRIMLPNRVFLVFLWFPSFWYDSRKNSSPRSLPSALAQPGLLLASIKPKKWWLCWSPKHSLVQWAHCSASL